MKDIIQSVSDEIAKEIITRPKFDLEEISGIIKFRLKESILEIMLANVEKEEMQYHRLLVEQSNLKLGSPKYVEMGYKLALAKNKKAVANRAVNNVKQNTKLSAVILYIKENFGEDKMKGIYDMFDEKGF